MRRVVVTGMGITSCLGLDLATVTESLRTGRSGIRFKQQYADMGFRSHVAGFLILILKNLLIVKYCGLWEMRPHMPISQ